MFLVADFLLFLRWTAKCRIVRCRRAWSVTDNQVPEVRMNPVASCDLFPTAIAYHFNDIFLSWWNSWYFLWETVLGARFVGLTVNLIIMQLGRYAVWKRRASFLPNCAFQRNHLRRGDRSWVGGAAAFPYSYKLRAWCTTGVSDFVLQQVWHIYCIFRYPLMYMSSLTGLFNLWE
jgi:hypothetical protein